MEQLLTRLWPLLRVLVAVQLAAYIKKIARRFEVTLSDDDAIELAAMVVAEITAILDRLDDPETAVLVQKTSAALSVAPTT